jgi:hypothetical protein
VSVRSFGWGALAARFVLLGLAAAQGCTVFDPINPRECGNHVLDPGEDCDGSVSTVPAEPPNKFKCAEPNEPGQCHFVASSAQGISCPSNMRRGADDVCRMPSGTFPTPKDNSLIPLIGWKPVMADFDSDKNLDIEVETDNAVEIAYLNGTSLVGARAFPKAPSVHPVIADFVGQGSAGADDAADILLPAFQLNNAGRLITLIGGPNQSLTPKTYSGNSPGVSFRTVVEAANVLDLTDASHHADLDTAGLVVDCNNTGPQAAFLCGLGPAKTRLFNLVGGSLPFPALHVTDIKEDLSPSAIAETRTVPR